VICDWCEEVESVYRAFLADEEFALEEPFLGEEKQQLRACIGCCKQWSGQLISRPNPGSPKFRIVMEHDDFKHIKLADLAQVTRTMICQVCGGKVAANPDDAFAYARRMLRLYPALAHNAQYHWTWTCDGCAESGHCPDCNSGMCDGGHTGP
jgi:hypothetical protein